MPVVYTGVKQNIEGWCRNGGTKNWRKRLLCNETFGELQNLFSTDTGIILCLNNHMARNDVQLYFPSSGKSVGMRLLSDSVYDSDMQSSLSGKAKKSSDMATTRETTSDLALVHSCQWSI